MWTVLNITFQKACSCFSAVSEHACFPVPWLALKWSDFYFFLYSWNASSFYWKLSFWMKGFKLKWTEEIADSVSLSQSLSSTWLDTTAAYYVRYSTNGAYIKMQVWSMRAMGQEVENLYPQWGRTALKETDTLVLPFSNDWWAFEVQLLFHWEEFIFDIYMV